MSRIGLSTQSHGQSITLQILRAMKSSVSASAKPMPVYLTSVCFISVLPTGLQGGRQGTTLVAGFSSGLFFQQTKRPEERTLQVIGSNTLTAGKISFQVSVSNNMAYGRLHHRPQGRGVQAPLLFRFFSGQNRSIKKSFFLFFQAPFSSIAILRIPVFSPCLPVVTSLAQCLPVIPVPEQFPVSSVWFDVVNHCCFGVPSLRHALHAERMGGKVLSACLLPGTPISSACGTSDLLRMEWFVFLTVFFPGIYQFRASWIPQWTMSTGLRSSRPLMPLPGLTSALAPKRFSMRRKEFCQKLKKKRFRTAHV